MITKYFPILLLFIIILGCSTTERDIGNIKVENQLDSLTFVTSYEQLNHKCYQKFISFLSPIYTESKEDSIVSIFKIEARLFSGHYPKEMSDALLKFCLFLKKSNEDFERKYFFGIDLSNNEFMFLHDLDTDLLTVDGHMRVKDDFSFLTECGIASNNIIGYKDSQIVFEIKYMFGKDQSFWRIDSIQSKDQDVITEYLASSNLLFIDSQQIVLSWTSDTLRYYSNNYNLYIEDKNKDTSEYRILSLSPNFRILEDNRGALVYLKKLYSVKKD